MTASPDSSIDKVRPEPLSAKLPPDALGETGLHKPPPAGFQLWLHRVLILLFVFFCATVGVLLSHSALEAGVDR